MSLSVVFLTFFSTNSWLCAVNERKLNCLVWFGFFVLFFTYFDHFTEILVDFDVYCTHSVAICYVYASVFFPINEMWCAAWYEQHRSNDLNIEFWYTQWKYDRGSNDTRLLFFSLSPLDLQSLLSLSRWVRVEYIKYVIAIAYTRNREKERDRKMHNEPAS